MSKSLEYKEYIDSICLDLNHYIYDYEIWRIKFTQDSLFPCNGEGFLVEGIVTEGAGTIIFYDAFGRRIGREENLGSYIVNILGGRKEEEENYYNTICQISLWEMEEIKKINLELEKYKK